MKDKINSSTTNPNEPNIKILVACHTPCSLIQNDILTPIHVGRALAVNNMCKGTSSEVNLNWMLSNTIGDNTGDNISEKNRNINELTALYWAWKNYDNLGNPDYIGLMHYRRHLCFNLENQEVPNRVGIIPNKKIDDEYIEKYGLTAEKITEIVKNYDIVVAEKCDLEKIGTGNCYNHYLTANPSVNHIKDYDTVINIINKMYPEYQESVKIYNSSRYAYFTNIFIMKKELFDEYASWIFPILFEAEKQIDLTDYNVAEARALGYISEWLFGIWYTHLLRTKDINSFELKRTFVEDTSPKITYDLKPQFNEKNIAVCLSTDINYISYLGVTIQSIIANASPDYHYDINILYETLPVAMQKKITDLSTKNVSIRFICMQNFLQEQNKNGLFFVRSHFSMATYFRFFLPDLMQNYDKVLYIDCDLVANKDIKELYETPLDEQYLLGAVKDFEVIRWATKDKNWSQSYLNHFLGISNVHNYFQAGVLLLNLKQMKVEGTIKKLFETLERIKTPRFVDQDIFNIVCEGRVLYLDPRWNVEYHIPIWNADWMQTMPANELYEYIDSRNNPYIIHYAGSKKPWHNAALEMADYWWKYARQTPFYEEILYKNLKIGSTVQNITQQITQQITKTADNDLIKEVASYSKNRFDYYRSKLLSKVTIGKLRKHYKNKKKKLKTKIKKVKQFLKGK